MYVIIALVVIIVALVVFTVVYAVLRKNELDSIVKTKQQVDQDIINLQAKVNKYLNNLVSERDNLAVQIDDVSKNIDKLQANCNTQNDPDACEAIPPLSAKRDQYIKRLDTVVSEIGNVKQVFQI
jgi:CHASE1-domain containing sensor protein